MGLLRPWSEIAGNLFMAGKREEGEGQAKETPRKLSGA